MKVGKAAAKSTDSSKTDNQVETYYTRALILNTACLSQLHFYQSILISL